VLFIPAFSLAIFVILTIDLTHVIRLFYTSSL